MDIGFCPKKQFYIVRSALEPAGMLGACQQCWFAAINFATGSRGLVGFLMICSNTYICDLEFPCGTSSSALSFVLLKAHDNVKNELVTEFTRTLHQHSKFRLFALWSGKEVWYYLR